MPTFSSKEAHQLLHNKFVVILGDSIQRCVYKDLVQLLQSDSLLTASQLKSKGELRFEDDHLVEGGVLGSLHNGTRYREVRQYRTGHHLVRFYFLTRVYSEYVESILEDFQAGPKPDVLVLNSCVWDVSRYGQSSMKAYRKNLETVFNRLDAVLPASCLVIWNMTMPLGPRVTGGFLIPELQHLSKTLRNDIIEGNFYGATLAGFHLFDVLDLHFHFRFDLRNRVKDGVHWNNVVHRRITNLLLTHVADAWRVVVPSRRRSPDDPAWNTPGTPLPPLPSRLGASQLLPSPRVAHPPPYPCVPQFYDDSVLIPSNWGPSEPISGFRSFEDPHFLTPHMDAAALHDFRHLGGNSAPLPAPFPAYPSHDEENDPPRSWRQRRRSRLGGHHGSYVMRRPCFYPRDETPYRRFCPGRSQRY
ncbi:PC-esterase domain-containing protein 1A [Podarcis muralis]